MASTTDVGTADSAAAAAAPSTITTVQLDGLALLKLLTHATESMPDIVTGQLVGLDVGNVVEITSSFPFPQQSGTGASTTAGSMSHDEYQLEMLKSLRTVNVDHNTMGWYCSTYFAGFYSTHTIEHQLSYQIHIPNSILLVYDPFTSTKGKLQLKAYRLSDEFIRLAIEKGGVKSTSTSQQISQAVNLICHDLEWHEILEELEIRVHNSHMVHGFLYELRESGDFTCESERLSLWPWSGPFLQRAMSLLSDSVDDYQTEAGRLAYYQRQQWRQKQAQQAYIQKLAQENTARALQGKALTIEEDRSKNPLFKTIPRPARTEAHAAANQIAFSAQQIQAAANQSIHKLYLTQALHKETPA